MPVSRVLDAISGVPGRVEMYWLRGETGEWAIHLRDQENHLWRIGRGRSVAAALDNLGVEPPETMDDEPWRHLV